MRVILSLCLAIAFSSWESFCQLPLLSAQTIVLKKAVEDKKEADKKEAPEIPKFDQKKADRETLRQAGLSEEPKTLLEFFDSLSLTEADRTRISKLIKQQGDTDFDARESASYDLIKYGVAAVHLLQKAEQSLDEEISFRCNRVLRSIEKVPTRNLVAIAARVLGELKPAGASERLIHYLPMADDESLGEEIRSALAALANKDGQTDKFLKETLGNKDVLLRGAAAEALARGGPQATREELQKFLEQEKVPEIQLRIAMGLVTGGKEKKMVPTMIKLMAEVPLEMGWRAEEILCRLASEGGPNAALGKDLGSREKARDEWLKWWDKHADSTDLAKLDDAERMLGNTLVAEWNIQGLPGRVAEIGADGKVIWELKNLQFPTDLLVLPGNRVVVVEQNINRVSERETLTGKEVWNAQLNQPIALQRLANGNLVITCRSEIFEWDRERKKLTTISRPQNDIVAGTKMRNGQFVIVTQQGEVVRYSKEGKSEKTFRLAGRANYQAAIQGLSNNRVLITDQQKVQEYDLDSGKPTGWSYGGMNFPTSAFRLPNGNTIVSSQNSNKAVEVDRSGREVWSYTSTDAFLRPWRVKRR